MTISNYLSNKLLDLTLRGTAYSAPTPYLALFTTMPSVANTGGVEVTGGSYARKAITSTNMTSPNGKASWNDELIVFDVPACTIVGGATYDASSGGNLLHLARFQRSITVEAGTFTLVVGTFVVEFR